MRKQNEDRALVGERIFVVADGVGGHNAGEVASSMVVSLMDDLDVLRFASADEAEAALADKIVEANDRIHQRAIHEPEREGMASTVTAALVHDRTLVLAQVGDTRAYLKRGADQLRRLTPDHSFVGALVDAGYITEEEARVHPKRSVILKAVGLEPTVEPEVGERVALQIGDEIVLVSDGVHGVIDEDHIERLVHGRPLDTAVDDVITAAREAGGPDNITVVVARAVADG
ncbi:protein phosphatase 2C domain-containing protein [Euzebya tangerina]|uniref:protein phosphatase 2C domain-containing protein n=1 Tax=Euzebya tangerina TaxID=591198 RepID=UPI0013C30817|nr:protein phosphatase 2C domain-containing protein [Euzebya tangerina]